MSVTYNDLYLDIRHALLRAGISAATLEARVLLCHISGKSPEELRRDYNLYVGSDTENRARALAARRLAGEPVAYLVEEWEFFGLPLDISRDVLIPRMDTEVLAEEAIRLARAAGGAARVLDLCTGSGCVGLAVASGAENCRVVLADVSEPALQICRRNIRRNAPGGRVTCVRADARETPAPALGEFDVIACNPPYIPSGDFDGLDVSVRDYEPRLALDGGADGLEFYRAIVSLWSGVLRPGGAMLFEVGIGQEDAVRGLMESRGYADLTVLADTQGIGRVVCGTLGVRPETNAEADGAGPGSEPEKNPEEHPEDSAEMKDDFVETEEQEHGGG